MILCHYIISRYAVFPWGFVGFLQHWYILMTSITFLLTPSNAIHDHRPRSSIFCLITLRAIFPKATIAVPPGLYSLPTLIALKPHTEFDAGSLFFVSLKNRCRTELFLVSRYTSWKHWISICRSIESWYVALILLRFILLLLNPEICSIPSSFFLIASPYVFNLSPVKFCPDKALISFSNVSLAALLVVGLSRGYLTLVSSSSVGILTDVPD